MMSDNKVFRLSEKDGNKLKLEDVHNLESAVQIESIFMFDNYSVVRNSQNVYRIVLKTDGAPSYYSKYAQPLE